MAHGPNVRRLQGITYYIPCRQVKSPLSILSSGSPLRHCAELAFLSALGVHEQLSVPIRGRFPFLGGA